MPEQYAKIVFIDEPETLTTYSYISNGLCFEYFVGYEITALLDYKDTNQPVKNLVSRCNQLHFREYPGIKQLYQHPDTILISRDGVKEILLRTRKLLSPSLVHILSKFQIDVTNSKSLSKEQQNLSFITNTFKIEEMIPQYPVGSYFLDLYFPKYKILIECDENGHSDRSPEKERIREDFVNNELDITSDNWVRFNPDAYDFEISKVIGQIYLKISMFQDQQVKRCCTCRKDKRLTDFYHNIGHADGRDKRCRECVSAYRAKSQIAREQIGIIVPDEKYCPQCDITKSKTEFYNHKSRKDGLNNICKECSKTDAIKKKYEPKIVVENKICSRCKETHQIANFHKCVRNTDGHAGVCKTCVNGHSNTKRAAKLTLLTRKCVKCKIMQSNDNYSKITCGLSRECNSCRDVLPGQKLCSACNIAKPVELFHRRSQSADGINGRCKDCIQKSLISTE